MNKNLIIAEKIQFELLNTIENEQFKGWDPYDLLSSPIIPNVQFSYLLMHLQRICPLNFRKFLLIKKDYVTKTFSLFIDSYLNLYSTYKDEIYLIKAKNIYEKMICNAVINSDMLLGWGRNYDFKTKGEFHDSKKPLIFLNAKLGLSILNLYSYTKDQNLLNDVEKIIRCSIQNCTIISDERGTYVSYSSEKNPRLIFNASILTAELMLKYVKFRNNTSEIINGINVFDLSNKLIDSIINQQLENGSWYYGFSFDGKNYNQVDFHQGFVIDSLLNITNIYDYGQLKDNIKKAYEKGIKFMATKQIENNGSFRWRFPDKYPIDIHNQAQGIISLSLSPTVEYDQILQKTFLFTVNNFWNSKRKYFYYQIHRLYVNKIHYIRWSSAWMLYAITLYIKKNKNICVES